MLDRLDRLFELEIADLRRRIERLESRCGSRVSPRDVLARSASSSRDVGAERSILRAAVA